jgi:predicted 3-demethylubiquinone-9 3-methyltransferase (glyoxalase superfamily)
MSAPFSTCLWFDGCAEEAVQHYLSVFKDGSTGRITRYTEAGPGPEGEVMAVEFTINGQDFMALNGGPMFKFTEAVSFQIKCADQDEIDYYWDRLTEGGEESQCGWLKDKFGVSWQVYPADLPDLLGDPERGPRTAQAMYEMSRIDYAALRKAYDGTG